MNNWISVSLALYLVGHIACFGVSRLIATSYKTYTLTNTAVAFFVSWVSLPIINLGIGSSPSAFVGTTAFYLASISASAIMLFILGQKIDPAEVAAKKLLKETKNRIAQEGFTAFSDGQPIEANPYRAAPTDIENKEHIDYWDRGYVLARNRSQKKG